MIALVPMRKGSKGIPDKNIRDFGGRPLFYNNIKVLLDYGAVVWVSTDSYKYAEYLEMYFHGLINIYYRSKRTGADTATTWDVVEEFIDDGPEPDNQIIGISQVTSPYLTAADVKKCVALCKRHKSVRTVGTTTRYYYDTYGKPINHSFPHKPRQKEKPTLVENGCLYVTTIGWIRENDCYQNDTTVCHIQPYSFELDTPEDWAYGEKLMGAEWD